eukprot:TRINITY_DN27732_c0_g1_i1.p1 TRINITY_DN27732_c0_g1~~TRINITY_DN27732_c0_g1_i1.p1  ORF type:complete len:262 (+),score=41.96 TRINITY_DN27732_c0_g1_i1:59-787(+)
MATGYVEDPLASVGDSLLDNLVLSCALVLLGILLLVLGPHLPAATAAAAAVATGLVVGLVVNSWQIEGAPLGLSVPPGLWRPVAAAAAAGLFAGVLVRCAWRLALALLTAALLALLALATCRLAGVPSVAAAVAEGERLSPYGKVGVYTFAIALIVCAFLVKKLHSHMMTLVAGLLGMLLVLAGLFSIVHQSTFEEQDHNLLWDLVVAGDDCGVSCKVNAILWIVCTALYVILRAWCARARK